MREGWTNARFSFRRRSKGVSMLAPEGGQGGGDIMGISCQAQCEYNFNNQYTNIPINYNNQTRSLPAHHRPIERPLAEQLRLHCFQISSV